MEGFSWERRVWGRGEGGGGGGRRRWERLFLWEAVCREGGGFVGHVGVIGEGWGEGMI